MSGTADLVRVFVYGTLCRGEGNHRLLAASQFLGTEVTEDPFRMYCIGFPLIKPGGDAPIAGEVYAVNQDTLAALDRLEAEGSMYDRTLIALSGRPPAYAYVWRRKPQGEAVPVTPGGVARHWPSWARSRG